MSEIKTISGDIVTYGGDNIITDVKSLTVDLEPIQDLHGYDKPWVGGAGKNKFEMVVTPYSAQGVTISQNGNYVHVVANSATGYPFTKVGAIPSTFPSGDYWFPYNTTIKGIEFRFIDRTVTPAHQIARDSNGRVTIPSGHNGYTVEIAITGALLANGTYDVSCALMSENIAWQPYSNICPISGRTEVVTHRTGKNLLNLDRTLGTPNPSAGTNTTSPRIMDTEHYYVGLRHDNYYYPSNVAEYSVANNEVTVRGKNNAYGVGFPIEVKPNTQYKVSATVDGSGYLGISYYDTEWNYISFDGASAFTTPLNASYAVILLRSLSTSATATWKNVQVELGSTATDYEPYNGNTYTTALGRTVYGGTLDVVSGVLTVDRAMATLVGGNWSKSSSYPDGFYIANNMFPTAFGAPKPKDKTPFICSHASTAKTLGEYVNGTCYSDQSTNIRIMSADTTASEWLQYLVDQNDAGTPVQVCYELATPQTYQLTPQQIEALFGVNNLWSSGGEVTLSYTENVLMPESVSINGKYLEAIVDGYLTLGTSGRRSLGRELDTYSVGSADGETVKGDRFPSRKITVNYVIQSDSEEELINSVNQLNNILNQDEADFVFRDESDKFFTGLALLDAEPKKYRHAVKGTWTLYCAYPFKRSVEPITLVSTNDASISGNSATFVFDYNGTRPARPVLRATFAAAKQNGDYSEDGDCGFVAFLDANENIIQLGNPEVVDVDQYAKNGTLANSSFNVLTGWTPTNVSSGQITDTYWNNGAGQTQQYAKPTGTASLTRTTAGAVDFEFDIVHRLCVSATGQTGKFEALTKNNGVIVTGIRIEKTGNGTTGIVSYILNDKVVGTDSIDLSYYNMHFGYCNRTAIYTTEAYQEQVVTYVKKKKKKKKKVTTWVTRTRTVQSGWQYTQSNLNTGWSKDGGVVTFSVGNLPDRTFKSSDIEHTASMDIEFNFTGSFHTNALHSCAMIAKAGVPFAEIPNVFTAGDIVQADCNDANVTLYRSGSLEGHLEPQYGALGNDWEDFVLKPGQNVIRAVWSDWVNTSYKPLIQIIFNEVYL